jgi:tartrate dehydratase beta subunit/fumarate hydratase class I family protein
VSKKGGMIVVRMKRMNSFLNKLLKDGGCALIIGKLTRPLRRITSHYHSLMRY